MAEISLKEYRAILEERPRKFSAKEVGFEPVTREYPCGGCLHYYRGVQAEVSVCEIFRPKGPDETVPPEGSCRFWTIDGKTFPRLQSEEDD
jgi:hypothetical protein